MKIVRAIRNGWIKPKVKSDGKPKYYLLWGKDDRVRVAFSCSVVYVDLKYRSVSILYMHSVFCYIRENL